MRGMRLRTKVLLGLALVLLPLLGLLTYGLAEQHALRRASLLSGMQQTAEAGGLLVDVTLEAGLALARALASDPAVAEGDPATLGPLLQRTLREHPDLISVAVVGLDGRARVVAPATAVPLEVRDRGYFQQAVETGAPVLSEVLVGRARNRPIAVAAAPIRGPRGALTGVLALGLSLERLGEVMGTIRMSRGQALFLTDPTGRLAFHSGPTPESWAARDVSGHPEVPAARAGEAVLSTDFRGLQGGGRRIAALVPTPTQGWIVGVTWGVQPAFAELAQARRMQLAGFGVLSLLAVLLAWALASQVTARVERLLVRVRALERGDFATVPPSDVQRARTGDELAQLSDAFTRMAEELRRERERRNTFISSVAHELRNAMSPVGLAAQALRRMDALPAVARERTVTRLVQQVVRLDRLVLDLLDASRIASGRFTLSPRACDVVAAARSVVEEQQAGAPGHTLVLRGPPALEAIVDPDRLAQVLTNLVGNAVKYSPAGGEVLVDVEAVGSSVRVAVRDAGIGLLPQEAAQLFQPYRRAEGARDIGGLGLGLSICRAIAEAHGGSITVQSEGRDRGATFTLTLPLRPRTDLSPEHAPPTP